MSYVTHSYMYNKIFTKILDSSIWLETDSTRIVWLTMIAAMDEDGFVQFASAANLAHRARVELAAAEAAIKLLESPDSNSSDPEHEGRRIERVPGGWVVLNSAKYRSMVTRAVSQEKTRERVARFRAKKVTIGNAPVTVSNERVTPSEAVSESEADNLGAKAPAKRNLLMDSLAKSTGINPDQIGAAIAKRLNKQLTIIKQSTPEVTPSEISTRAMAYRRKWPGIDISPEALAKHWAALAGQQGEFLMPTDDSRLPPNVREQLERRG